MDESSSTEVVISWSGIWVTGLVSFIQGLVFYSFFRYRRGKDAPAEQYDLYEPRQHTRQHRSPPPFAGSWYKAAWNVSQEETLRCVGLDSYMFLRFLRLGARICTMGCVLALVLIPTYATGEERGRSTQQFNQLTLARVSADSKRLWASLIAWWIFVGFVLYELWNEWVLYAHNRYEFLARGDVDMPKGYRYAVRVEQIPPAYRTDQALLDYFERLFPGSVEQATVFWKTDKLQALIDERQVTIEKLESAVAFTHGKPNKPRPKVKVGATMGLCGGSPTDAIEHYKIEIDRLNEAIDMERSMFDSSEAGKATSSKRVDVDDGNIETSFSAEDQLSGKADTSTAFVTFSNLRTKQAAVQCELTGNPDSMIIFPAPDPKGVLWKNISVPLPQQQILQVQAAALWLAGILFWAAPVSFVTSIANLNSILESIGVDSANPDAFWYGLVSGLLPVIALAILMAVLYMAIVAAAKQFVRYKSMAEVDAYALYWHQLFQFANLWLILIGGSVFNQIDALISDFNISAIVDIIASALPGASVFFVNMMLVSSFGSFGMELSMLPTYGIKLIMQMIQPEAMRTQRQLDQGKEPPSLEWGQKVPPVVFMFLVVVLYMPIVPLMEVFGLIYFAGSYLVMKHQCLHVYAQEFEGGGDATWQKLFGFLIACLYMGEVIFIAYMGIKEAPAQGVLGFFPLVGTIIMQAVLKRNIIQPLANLSLEVAATVDIEDGELDTTTGETGKLYGMPALDPDQEERGPMPYRRDGTHSDGTGDMNMEQGTETGLEDVRLDDTKPGSDKRRFV